MKVTNTSTTRIDAYAASGGDFPGLDAGETIVVSDAVAADLGRRYPFLLIKDENVVREKVEVSVPKAKPAVKEKVAKKVIHKKK